MSREQALEHAVKLLIRENDALRDSAGMANFSLGRRDFPPIELARGSDLPGLVHWNEGTLSVRLES